MGLKSRLRRHKQDYPLMVALLLGLLLVCSAALYFLLRERGIPQALITNRLVLFALFYVNIILILAILFVLLRNIFKLLLERRVGLLGSKLKTKLVVTNVGLTLIPVLLLFITAFGILRDSIDRWFTTPQRRMLEQGRNVAQALREELEREVARNAGLVLQEVADLEVADPSQTPELERRLRRFLVQLDLDLLAVYAGTDFVYQVSDPEAGRTEALRLRRSFLAEAVSEGEAVTSLPLDLAGDEGLVLAARSPGSTTEERPAVVVAGNSVPQELMVQMNQLIQDYQTDRQLEVQQEEIKASYLLLFLMVTLVILLISSWLGLVVARRVTVPLQALAEGTRRVSRGDLAHRVEADTDDELGIVVDSFNRMTEELAHNREVIEASHRQLLSTNERLAEERALMAAVLENVAGGVVSLDRQGRILTCNGAALEMLGQSEDELLGRPAQEAWDDPERRRLLPFLEEGHRATGPDGDEVQLAVRGEWRTLAVKVTGMVDASGRRRGRVMLLEDLTELTRAQQLAAWTEAARRIAHEIKNPLTPIRLTAERLLRKHQDGQDLGETIEDAVAIINREVTSMQGMVDEFSRYARMPGPRPMEVSLEDLIQDTLRLYRDIKPGVEVAGTVAEDCRHAWLDPEQIKRALINLLDNALAVVEPPGEVTVEALRRGERLEIRVADTGPGIPPEAKEKLFLPHFSTKGRGTGLGLAIVHRIVTDHHGAIRVEDQEPRGTVFILELPGLPRPEVRQRRRDGQREGAA